MLNREQVRKYGVVEKVNNIKYYIKKGKVFDEGGNLRALITN